MSKKKRSPRPRTLERIFARRDDKLAEAREKLASLEPGGSAERPLEVASASVIVPRAESEACLRCGGRMRCEEHLAHQAERELLRMTRLRCRECGARRELFFQIAEKLLN